ncbi:MAG: squalene--hopene cyclase [Planctomycetota bacterium]|nr:squalene--hopene cyclase [Planctomycetota bacterium]MDA0919708.1 squalene--hopene cyclase [Planctomycetota bacterium]MDA1159339.1 squalene--hopene cyclase [Planctomycetota bacterium]
MTSLPVARTRCAMIVATILLSVFPANSPASAQPPNARIGEAVPRDVREIYDKGLQFLVTTQSQEGGWLGGQTGPGVTGLGLMVFLASGEDPNFGKYSGNVRRAVRSLITDQDKNTGYLGNSMYHHGFGMLGLAEAYGAVDDRRVWPDGTKGRTIGESLELAVRAALTSQKNNSRGAWRYSPTDSEADTSVSGAVLVGLLAARNAGIEVPDTAIDKAITYYTQMTSPSGQVAYSGGLGGFDESLARISIATLVYAVAKRKDLPQFKSTLGYLVNKVEFTGSSGFGWINYQRYYQAQALFQGDVDAWERWNKLLIRQLKTSQLPDGSFPSQHGASISTSMSLLSLALNYRLLPIYER